MAMTVLEIFFQSGTWPQRQPNRMVVQPPWAHQEGTHGTLSSDEWVHWKSGNFENSADTRFKPYRKI